jgi:actin-related protein
MGLHEILFDTLKKLEDINKLEKDELFDNILLTGGNTLHGNFKDRMINEMNQLTNNINNLIPRIILESTHQYKFVDKSCEKYLTWKGGSILASLSSFQTKWITKKDYDEIGPKISLNN